MEEERARWHEDLVASCRVASHRVVSRRIGQMLLACVPMKIRERDGDARVCRAEEERASFLLHAAISHGSSCFGFSCGLQLSRPRRRDRRHSSSSFSLSLSLSLSLSFSSSYSRVLPVEKTTNAPEFKGRRLSCPGSYWSRQYSSNEVSRSIGNWCCNRSDLPFYVSRVPFCSVASHSYYRRNLLRSTLLPLCFCSVDAATSTYN